MKKISNRFQSIKKIIEAKHYSIDNAISLIKKLATAKFDESVEAHISLNINPKYANQQLRASLLLPHNVGKPLKIAVFTDAELVNEAILMGASVAGSEDLLEQIGQGQINFDVLLTSPSQMPKLAKFGRLLGPKGLMPSPKSGTITENLKRTLEEFKKGKLEYRADKGGTVHLRIGKSSFSESQLKENLMVLCSSIEKNKPLGVKGKYFKSFSICTTMSPAIKLDFRK